MDTITDKPNQGGGVLKEVMSTPLFKDILRGCLKDIDPQVGRSIVKTAIWQDPEIILSILGELPSFINSFIGAITEMATQLNNNISPHLTKNFIEALLNEIDKHGLEECAGTWAMFIKRLWEASPEAGTALRDAVAGPGAKVIAKGINTVARRINSINRDDPRLMTQFISDVRAYIDTPELKEATYRVADAFFDQKLNLISWAWSLVLRKIRGKFKGRK